MLLQWNCDTSEGSSHCNICCSPLSLPSLVTAAHHSHNPNLHPRQLRDIMFNDSLDFCASPVTERFHSVLHFPALIPVWAAQAAITGGKPRPSSLQLPLPAPPRENHGVSGSDGRYNPSAVCWVRLRSSLWLAHAQNSRKDTQEASWCHLLNYLKCPLLM